MGTGGDPKSALSLSAKLIIYWQVGELVCALFVVWGTRAAEEQKKLPLFCEKRGEFCQKCEDFRPQTVRFFAAKRVGGTKGLGFVVGGGGG